MVSIVKLHRIEWDDCFSFGSGNSITLSEDQVTQIVAPNGYGKSSIPLILEECLFNKNSKGVTKADIPNRILDNGYSIKVWLFVDEDEYLVDVQRSSSIKIKLIKNGTDISSHTATNTFKELQDILGFDFKTFQQLVNQSITNSLQFLTSTDTNRKKFLLELFDLSEYTVLFETFKEAVKNTGIEQTKLGAKLSTVESWLKSNSKLDTNYIPVPDKPVGIDYSNKITKLSNDLKNIEATNKAILSNNSISNEISSYKPIDTTGLIVEKTDQLSKQVGAIEAEKRASESVIAKLKGLGDKCPTCLQDIDKGFYMQLMESNSEIVDSSIRVITGIKNKITEIESTNAIITKANTSKLKYDKLVASFDESLPKECLSNADISSEIQRIRAESVEQDKRLAEIIASIAAAEKHNNKVEVYLEQNDKFNTELRELSEALANINGTLDKLEVLKKSFSTTGLLTYELENLVKDLEVFTNEYLAEFSDGRFSIEFSLISDKLNVILFDDGQQINTSSPSSGEMARINISTLLAIRKLMASISKNTINLLFIDEIMSVLDDYGKDKLVEVLIQEGNLNTFVVSHSWSHPLVSKLIITKEDGISSIEYG